MTRPDDEIMHAIDLTACHDVLESVPDGLDSPLPEKGRSLSGGQRQRVALARALLTQSPRLLLIDPTSAVDAHTEARISAHIAAERAGKATLIATTSPLMLEHMDIIHVLDAHGTLLGSGTYHDLLTGDTPQARTYRATTTRTLTDEDTTHVTH
jgi:ABC-type multidrug transport system fused ATPase/permease subunit